MSATHPAPYSALHAARSVHWGTLAALGLASALLLFAPWSSFGLGGWMVLILLLALWVFSCTWRGRTEPVALLWVAVFPLGYYFLSFPFERPLLTLDRVLIPLLAAGAWFGGGLSMARVPGELRRAALAWLCFNLAAVLSVLPLLTSGIAFLRGGQVLLDGFMLPALFGWYVLCHFRVRRHLASLHVIVAVVALYLAAIGLAEMLTWEDILPLPRAVFFMPGVDFTVLPRVNGPLETNNSYGLIGLIAFFFLLFLRRAQGSPIPFWQRMLHLGGLGAALLAALLPMFRSIALTLIVVFLIHLRGSRGKWPRIAQFALLGLVAAALLASAAFAPDFFQERVADLFNVYGRVAQYGQSIALFMDNPLTGVGLSNFFDAAMKDAKYAVAFGDVGAVDYPHSNLGAVLVETGLLGFVPYFLAQVFLVRAFWKLRNRRTPAAQTAWAFFLYVFLSYWVSGLTLTSGYYSDLNLWFLFVVSVIYQIGCGESRGGKPQSLACPLQR
jgi:O-antigen ligase